MFNRLNAAARASRGRSSPRPCRGPDEAAALPRHPRRPRRLLLRRRPVDRAAAGGTATRLTAHPGLELFPKFSPDGKWIAFTGQYDGDEQVYVIPAAGGVPKQLTYYPARGPAGRRAGATTTRSTAGRTTASGPLPLHARRDGTLGDRLYTVPVAGGLAEALPMPVSGAGRLLAGREASWSTRRCFRDFRTWKRYEGGLGAGPLHLRPRDERRDAGSSPTPRTERDPMWIGERDLLRLRPRRHAQPLRVRRRDAGRTAQLTQSTDVGRPLAELDDARAHRLRAGRRAAACSTSQTGRRDRHLRSPCPTTACAMRPSRVSAPSKNVEDFALSPKGERALFVGARRHLHRADREGRRPAT